MVNELKPSRYFGRRMAAIELRRKQAIESGKQRASKKPPTNLCVCAYCGDKLPYSFVWSKKRHYCTHRCVELAAAYHDGVPLRLFVFDDYARHMYQNPLLHDYSIVGCDFSTKFGALTVIFRDTRFNGDETAAGLADSAAQILQRRLGRELTNSSYSALTKSDLRHPPDYVIKEFERQTLFAKAVRGTREYFDVAQLRAAVTLFCSRFNWCAGCCDWFPITRKIGKTIDGLYFCRHYCHHTFIEKQRYYAEAAARAKAEEERARIMRESPIKAREAHEEERKCLREGKLWLRKIRQFLRDQEREAQSSQQPASEPVTTSQT